MIRVVNKNTHTPTSNDVYIGRGSKWGNPFKIGTHLANDSDGAWSREEVIHKYKLYITHTKRHLLRDLPELTGKNLVCYCAPLACHGDVLKELAESEYFGTGMEDFYWPSKDEWTKIITEMEK